MGTGVAAAGLGAGAAVLAGPVAASQQRPATASFAAYMAAFNSESTANQITSGSVGNSAHLDRAAALKDALRQEPKAVVLGSGPGTFKAAFYHYKPLPVWVFTVDPRGPHNQPDAGPPFGSKATNSRYNYDVIVERARTGGQLEEAQGWDNKLPPLPSEPQ